LGLFTLFSLNSTTYAGESISELVNKKATEHKVPVAFAQALIKHESNYNPKARGLKGEYGLGQILCSTARGIGFRDKCDKLLDPETNLEYSMIYLRLALDKSGDDICFAATMYSAGLNHKPTKSRYCREILKKMG